MEDLTFGGTSVGALYNRRSSTSVDGPACAIAFSCARRCLFSRKSPLTISKASETRFLVLGQVRPWNVSDCGNEDVRPQLHVHTGSSGSMT